MLNELWAENYWPRQVCSREANFDTSCSAASVLPVTTDLSEVAQAVAPTQCASVSETVVNNVGIIDSSIAQQFIRDQDTASIRESASKIVAEPAEKEGSTRPAETCTRRSGEDPFSRPKEFTRFMVVKTYEVCVTGVAMLDRAWQWLRSECVQSYNDITALMPYELLGIFGISVLYAFVSVWCFSGGEPVGSTAYVSALQRTTFLVRFLEGSWALTCVVLLVSVVRRMSRRKLVGASVTLVAYLQWSTSLVSSDGQPGMGLLDSGATNVLVPNANMLHTIDSYDSEHIAGMGHTQSQGTGSGTVVFPTDGGFTYPLDVSEALITPDQPLLLSEGALEKFNIFRDSIRRTFFTSSSIT